MISSQQRAKLEGERFLLLRKVDKMMASHEKNAIMQRLTEIEDEMNGVIKKVGNPFKLTLESRIQELNRAKLNLEYKKQHCANIRTYRQLHEQYKSVLEQLKHNEEIFKGISA